MSFIRRGQALITIEREYYEFIQRESVLAGEGGGGVCFVFLNEKGPKGERGLLQDM
jgi:hypothetical protein